MAKFGIQNSLLANVIDVGRLNKDQTMFVEKEDHTYAAIFAVVDHVATKYKGHLEANVGQYRFEITVTESEGEGQ